MNNFEEQRDAQGAWCQLDRETQNKLMNESIGMVQIPSKKVIKALKTAPKERTMRSQEEIVARIEEIKKDDFFGFETSDLIDFLDFEHAKQYLKPEATAKEWDAREHKTAEESIKSYMAFAWEKANDKRGISASRSVSHMRSWAWLAGNQELTDFINEEGHYAPYGKPILAKICEVYNLPNQDNGDTSCQ